MKTDVETMRKIEDLFQAYESEVKTLEDNGILSHTTSKTYLSHAHDFVKWCRDEFEPGIRKK